MRSVKWRYLYEVVQMSSKVRIFSKGLKKEKEKGRPTRKVKRIQAVVCGV